MKKSRVILIGIVVVIVSVITILRSPSETTILLPSPIGKDKESSVVVIANDLDFPTGIGILPNGNILTTEQKGNILFFANNGSLINKYKIPDTYFDEGAGLLGIAIHPEFNSNHYLYIYYTYKNNNNSTIHNKIVRLEDENNRITNENTILDGLPASKLHNGGAIKFGPDNKLYVSVGDTTNSKLAQNISSLAGKILRINDNGTIPSDNPFQNSMIYSYGHRNVVGLAWDYKNNTLYASEAGRIGNDEINKIEPKHNYGWDIEECGTLQRNLFTSPEFCFTPAIYPAGMVVSESNKLGYEGKLIVATLKGEHLRSIDPITKEQDIILTGFGKLKDVNEDVNGTLYIITNNKDFYENSGSDKMLKIIKVN